MTNACPECGTPVSERAAVCPQCGFPLRRDAIPVTGAGGPPPGYGAPGGYPGGPQPGYGASGGYPGAPPPKKSNAAAILIAVIGGGFALVVVLGIVAALAIPRFAGAAIRAKQQEGSRMLRDAYTAEQGYLADHGEYTTDVEELKSAGWRDAASANYTLRIASAEKNRLCVEVDPKPGASGVYAMSMDGTGKQYYVAGCGYSDGTPAVGSAVDDGPNPLYADGDTTGRRMMTEVYQGIVAYRAEHGRDPTKVAQVLSLVHQTPATRNYAMHVSNGRNGFCVVAQPREYPDDVHSWAVDAKGLLFDGAVCMGEAVDSLDRAPVAEP
jgi:type II secretory pathway pseudopilin PulG